MKFFQTIMIVSAMSSSMAAAIDVSLAAGRKHTCALLGDGKVECWGDNSANQLGGDTGVNYRATPQQVLDLTNVKAISAGGTHTCALLEDGGVECWGKNYYKQLGVDTLEDSATSTATPQQVGDLADVKAISAGGTHTCALLVGIVKCWGANFAKQLGVDTGGDLATPQQVGDLTNVKAISVGGWHTCALLEDKTVKCWGSNNYKQLGVDTGGDLATPQQVGVATPQQVLDLTNVKAISVGGWHTCALLEDKTVKCWGSNNKFQLGGDTGVNYRATPQQVGDLADVKAISAGEYHTCALLEDKTVKCWGDTLPEDATATATPQQVGDLADVKAISAGGTHTCALLVGIVKCWGRNDKFQLGVDTVTVTAIPQQVQGLTLLVPGPDDDNLPGPDYDNLMLDNYETPYEKARDEYFYWLAELEKVAPPYKSSRDAFVRGTLIYIEKDIGHEGKFTKLPKRQSDLQQDRLARLNQKINSFAGHRRLTKADWDPSFHDNAETDWKDRHAPPAGYHYGQRAKHEQTQMGYRKEVADEKDKHETHLLGNETHLLGTFEQNHPLYKAYTFYKRMTTKYLSVTDQVRKAANIYDARREAFMSMTDALSSNIASGDFDIGDLMTVSTDDVRELIKEEGAPSKLRPWRRLSNSVSKESLTKLQLLQGSYWQSQSSEEKFNIVEQIQKILKRQGKKRLRSSRPREFFKSDEFIPVPTARLLKRSRHVLVEKLSRKKSGELVILQHLYWKTKNSEVKYKTAQSIEQLILK